MTRIATIVIVIVALLIIANVIHVYGAEDVLKYVYTPIDL